MPQHFKRPSSSEPASRTTRLGGVGVAASTTAARPSAVQVEIQCANSVLIGVRRVDGVGNPVQVRHHLLVGPAVSKDLAPTLVQVTALFERRLCTRKTVQTGTTDAEPPRCGMRPRLGQQPPHGFLGVR